MESGLKQALRRRPFLFHLAKAAQAAVVGARRIGLLAARPGAVRRYLARHAVRCLQLGCGEHPDPAWLNTDLAPRAPGVIFLDVTRRFPFADATFDYAYSEHLVEHLPYDDARHLLAEAGRVLKPGGRIRVATPDLALLAALLTAPPGPTGEAYLHWIARTFLGDPGRATAAFVLNHNMRAWGHEFLYDEATLRDALAAAGFRDIVRRAAGESDDPRLRGLETHARTVGDEAMVAYETMVLEAVKPASA